MNVSRVPATTPGSESGQVILRKVVHAEAYRSAPASSSRRSIFSRLAYSGSVMNGRKLYVKPEITANGGLSSWSLCTRCSALSTLNSPRSWKTRETGPESERIVCQARVLIKKLVKNGAITSTSSRFFHLPDLNAMV